MTGVIHCSLCCTDLFSFLLSSLFLGIIHECRELGEVAGDAMHLSHSHDCFYTSCVACATPIVQAVQRGERGFTDCLCMSLIHNFRGTLCHWFPSKENCVLHHEYIDISTKPAPLYSPSFLPSHKQNYIYFTSILAKLPHMAMLIPCLADTLLAVGISWAIDNMAKEANLSNNAITISKLCSLNGGFDGEYNGVGFMEISEIFATHDAIFIETAWFGRVYDNSYPKMWLLDAQIWSSTHNLSGTTLSEKSTLSGKTIFQVMKMSSYYWIPCKLSLSRKTTFSWQ